MAWVDIANGESGSSVRTKLNALGAAIPRPSFVSGNWISLGLPGISIAAGGALTANSIRFMPFYIGHSVTFNSLGARITTLAAGGNIKLALYANNPVTGRPTGPALASTANIATDAAAVVTAAIAETSVTLAPGWYWMAAWADNNTVVMLAGGGSSTLWTGALIGAATAAVAMGASATDARITIASAAAYGAWPDLTAASFTEVQTSGNAILIAKVA